MFHTYNMNDNLERRRTHSTIGRGHSLPEHFFDNRRYIVKEIPSKQFILQGNQHKFYMSLTNRLRRKEHKQMWILITLLDVLIITNRKQIPFEKIDDVGLLSTVF